MLKKLKYYGIRGAPLNLLKSYLSNRFQYVEFNGVQSKKAEIVCGVPQGSILGPLLFLLYINDLANASKLIFSVLFADDSNLFLTDKNPNELIKIMNKEISHVVNWLNINKLSINLKKTHYMIFRKRRVKLHITETLCINNVKIDQIDKTKFLGVVIDPYLNFHDHIAYLRGKIARSLGLLYRGRKFFNEKTLLTLYNVFIYPYYMYCNEVWGNTYQSYLDPLIKIQKRAIRVIASEKRLSHTEPLFKKLKLLKLKEIHAYVVQLFMFKFHHAKLPKVFDDFFTRNNAFHNYSTRQNNKLHVPQLEKLNTYIKKI